MLDAKQMMEVFVYCIIGQINYTWAQIFPHNFFEFFGSCCCWKKSSVFALVTKMPKIRGGAFLQ